MKWRFTCLLFLAMVFAAVNAAAQDSITYYVSDDDGNDANDGLSPTTAFESLRKAIVVMRNSNAKDVTILVEGGSQYPYDKNGPTDNIADSTFRLFRNENNQAGKSLRVLGGYNFITGTRDLVDDKTELKGRFDEGFSINHIITLGLVNPSADSLVIEGFKIREADRVAYGNFEFVPGAFSSRASGGGIYITGCNNNKIVIRNCFIESNEKPVGGAVSVTGSSGISFQNCLFSGNRAIYDESAIVNSGVGSAAYIAFSNVDFQGCVFIRSGSAESRYGSVMYISNSGGETVNVVNCTVTASRGLAGYGSFYVESGNLRLINSIVWNNQGARIIKSSSPTANANIFLSNTIYEWADQYGEDVKFTTAPGFFNENAPFPSGNDGSFELVTCAATFAIDGGNNASWPTSVTTDIMGRPRIVAGKIDLGAYEEQTSTVYQYWTDADGDGFGPKGTEPLRLHCQTTGYAEQAGDCNDNDNTIYPGATEICGDGKDNNCDGVGDIEVTRTLNLDDKDGDGYGDSNAPLLLACNLMPGYSSVGGDCDDNNKDIHPNATEICDGIDNNCNGQTDEGITKINYYLDADEDGYGKASDVVQSCDSVAGRVTNNTDCDDSDSTVHPGATEVCGDEKDNDCNGFTDNVPMIVLFPDVDGDGFGNPAGAPILACDVQLGYARNNLDCNDNNNAVHPNATEMCDGKDNNCNGQTDEGKLTYYLDTDGDGYGSIVNPIESCTPVPDRITQGGDCNDNDNAIHPGAAEICDGKDNDCNGAIDNDFSQQLRWYRDSDGDGFGYAADFVMNCDPVFGRVDNDDDCNDNDNTIYPNAPEFCDGKDNNCNAAIDEVQSVKQYLDADSDGYGNPANFMTSCSALAGRVLLGGDCNDNDNTVFPGVGGCASLPLTLVDFTVKEEGQKAIASWTTTDEINTHHFDLEKSADGNQFLKIATLPAMNAPGDHTYSYIDPQPFAGKNYYRIKMVDLDGTHTYSRIASLRGNDTRAISAIYPNPASDIVNVVIGESSNDLSVQLISIDGKLMQTKRLAVRGTYQLNVAKLPAGIYFIKVSNGETYKLIKQ